MSMIGRYLRLSQDEARTVLGSPEDIAAFLYPEHDADSPSEHGLEVDRAWHLIHFLLTASTWSGPTLLSNVVMGGVEVGTVDVGYGPARCLNAAQVAETASALAPISFDELWSRFDPEKVREADIYPSGWEGNETERQYVREYFGALKAYYEKAARSGDAMLLYIN